MTDDKITEQEIDTLVDTFYAQVQQDPEIGPVFNERVEDWPTHLALLKNFWSSILLTTGRYKGHPMMTHRELPIEDRHFRRWLQLFAETARKVMPPAHADQIIQKSERIAENLKMAIAYQRGTFTTPLPGL